MKNRKSLSSERPSVSRLSPRTIAFLYAFIGGLWILASDWIVKLISNNPDTLTHLQTYKGWLYVVMTALMLYGLIRSYGNRLIHSNRRITEVLESISDGFFALDEDLVVTYFNKAAERLLGRKSEYLRGRRLFEAFPEAKGSVFEEHYTRALKEKRVIAFETYFGTRPYDNWYDVRVYPLDKGIAVYFQVTTERKRIERTLRESAYWQKAILNNIPDMAWLKDSQGKYIAVNEAFAASSGKPAGEIVGRTDVDLWAEAGRKYQTDDQRVIRSGSRKIIEETFVNGEGETLWLETIKTPLYNDGGDVVGTAGIARDISGRKRVDEALRESEERFRNTFEHAAFGMALVDNEGRFLQVNQAACNMFGYLPEELIGKQVLEIAHGDDRDASRLLMEDLRDGHKDHGQMEKRYLHKNGHTIWGSSNISALRDTQGKFLYYIAEIEDITERKIAEERVLKERDFSRVALDSLPGIVYLFDANGRFMRWNRNFELVSEYSSEEISSMSPLDFFIGADKFMIQKKIQETFEKGSAEAEAEFITKSGKHKPYYYTGRTIQVEGKPCLIGMGIDIADRKRIDEALRKSEEHFRRLTEQSPVPIAISNERKEIEYVNEQFVRTFGYTLDDIPNIDAWFVLAYPDPAYRREVIAIWEQAVEEAIQQRSVITPREYRVTCKDGTVRTVEIFGSIIGNREQVIFNDVTDRRKAETAISESRGRFKNLVEASSDWVWETDGHGVYTYASPKVSDILGYKPEEVLGKTPFDFMPPEEAERVSDIFTDIAASQRPFSLLENVNLHKNGNRVVLETSGVPFFDNAGSLKGYRGIDRDITERKRAEETIRYQAYHDLLTGLPNRALFADLLDHEILEMQRLGKKLAVLFLGIDQFKNVNDSFGHAAGDQLIRHIAAELKNSIREFDTLARIGGDEFALLLSLLHRPEDATRIADKVMQTFNKPFTIDHHEIRLTASIGISLCPEDGSDAGSLLKNADIALHFAKDQGRDNYQFYNSSISHRTLERVIFENRLRQAVERGEMVVHYQPQRNIKTGKITGAEALVRWNHPDLGTLGPAQFIPLAEETGLIIEIDQWVLSTACKQVKTWETSGHALPFVTTNLSARQFQQTALAGMIGEILEKTALRPENLGIEITETLAMRDTALTTRNLNLLNAMGVKLIIDDFGTGYSSLSYLKKLPIHKLKIDKSFITDLAKDKDDQAITNAIVAMAHILKLKVIAEGVETKGQETLLESQDCDEMQGFLFSKPVPAGEFEKLLAAGVH